MKPLILTLLLTVPSIADVQGDCDGNGIITITDAVCLINYIFLGVEPPRLEWWERDTVSTIVEIGGHNYPMEWHNIEAWTHFVVAGNDTGKVQWLKIGESVTMNGNRFVVVKQ